MDFNALENANVEVHFKVYGISRFELAQAKQMLRKPTVSLSLNPDALFIWLNRTRG